MFLFYCLKIYGTVIILNDVFTWKYITNIEGMERECLNNVLLNLIFLNIFSNDKILNLGTTTSRIFHGFKPKWIMIFSN